MPSPGQNRLATKRRRLKKRGWDGVTDEQIYQRDGWRCRLAECLCPDGRDIDQSLRGDPASSWAPGIHHIIRLADGGTNSASNKLAAHNKCSSMANREIQRAQAAPDPAPGVVLVRLIGEPSDIDAALAALAASGGWEVATRATAPRQEGHEKVVGLLTVLRVTDTEEADR